jgi:hypothetical protein
VSGWPAGFEADRAIYNPDEGTIWFTQWRGQVFRLPVVGGAVSSVGGSADGGTDWQNTAFWDPLSHKMGVVFGYGYLAVRNWRWELGTNDVDWVQIEANVPGREPWGRACWSQSVAFDLNGRRLFVYTGEGNSSGNQYQLDTGFSISYDVYNNASFDFLRDLWLLDLTSNQWNKLIALNTSTPVEGQIVYFPPLDSLFMVNGYQIPAQGQLFLQPDLTGLWAFKLGQSTNWEQVSVTGDVPAGADEFLPGNLELGKEASVFYDAVNSRIIHFNSNGVYALTFAPPTPPTITSQPQSVTVSAYGNATFNVTASGTAPLSYQWSFNGTDIAGATLSSMTITNVVQTNLGTYAVAVGNALGATTSSNAVLSMYPFLAGPFSGLVTDWGFTNTLSVGAWGTGPLSYQWFDNGVAIPNATNSTLTLASVQFTNAGLYSVVVSSPLGSVTNTSEQVVVNPAGVSLGMFPGVYVSGVVGYTYKIQSTSDLSDTNSWSTVATLTLLEPVQLWVDVNVNAASPTNAHRFYRVEPGP